MPVFVIGKQGEIGCREHRRDDTRNISVSPGFRQFSRARKATPRLRSSILDDRTKSLFSRINVFSGRGAFPRKKRRKSVESACDERRFDGLRLTVALEGYRDLVA